MQVSIWATRATAEKEQSFRRTNLEPDSLVQGRQMLRGGLGGLGLHVGLHLAIHLCGGASSCGAGCVDAGRHVMRMERRRR